MMNEVSELKEINKRIGYELLGPVVHRWLLGLHQYISYFDDGETAFLFCARAGVRINNLYRTFLEGAQGSSHAKTDMFWISRVSIAKGIFNRARNASAEHIGREYHHHPLYELTEGILRHHPQRLDGIDLSKEELKAHGFNFGGWIQSNQKAARVLRDYLDECSLAFDAYLRELLAGRQRAVLIDSGWQGSAQSMLSKGYPDIDWQGLYFGRILTPEHDPKIVSKVIGLMFESDEFDSGAPVTAFVRHRHVIEALLEPNAPSIEEVPMFEFKEVAQSLIEQNLKETPDLEKDSLYLHVLNYIRDKTGIGFAEIEANYQAAMPELARVLVHPQKNEALAFFCKERSADFGKPFRVPVLIDPENGEYEDSDKRIAASLWSEGQIALEYTGKIAHDSQCRAAGLSDNQAYFDPHWEENTRAADEVSHELPARPKVAIITRTKNRPLLLERAARSVACQTHTDFEWVIVNDGGDEDAVRDVVAACTVDVRKITLVSNRRSLGMEAASNAGIRNSNSEYVVIHDDDDSWAPDFLQKTVAYLESAAGKRYGGVITHSLYVSEEINGHNVIEHERRPYQNWVRNVQLAEMAIGNFFAPIAFVYRRTVWEDVGGYNEQLPVLGDWYFNLEFLLRADIGVIPEPLAYYHHRDRGDSRNGIYANSVIGGISKHEEFASIARNEFLRRNLEKFPAAVGVLVGYTANLVRDNAGMLLRHINSGGGKIDQAGNSDQRPQDLVDKYWAVAQINLVLSSKSHEAIAKRLWRRKGSSKVLLAPLDPVCSWDEIGRALSSIGKVPALEDFNEAEYLRSNPDVAAAVRDGQISSGYFHYLIRGRNEGRVRPTYSR